MKDFSENSGSTLSTNSASLNPNIRMSPRAVVLLSGGLDSATCAVIAKSEGFEVCGISFRYGQRHAAELDAARRIAAALRLARHLVVDLDLGQFGGSALTAQIDVPKRTSAEEIGGEIPVTYVLHWSKAQIIRRGLALGVDYGLTTSCYDPSADGAACGCCDACLLRLRGFAENHLADPAPYRVP